jgi:ubiquinone/menaquinone biosynthesis C-methylase UbiE
MNTKFDWDAVWDRKGSSESADAIEISGFESVVIDTAAACAELCRMMDIQDTESALEIGCGAGLLARHMKCTFVGTDRSPFMVKKAIEVSHLSAVVCDADYLIFRDKSFDHVYAFGVFHYFPDYEYANRCIAEMKRVARKGIAVLDVPLETHDSNHLLFEKDFFPGWDFGPPLYQREHKRYNAYLRL